VRSRHLGSRGRGLGGLGLWRGCIASRLKSVYLSGCFIVDAGPAVVIWLFLDECGWRQCRCEFYHGFIGDG
jgi:hypothetical protein